MKPTSNKAYSINRLELKTARTAIIWSFSSSVGGISESRHRIVGAISRLRLFKQGSC